MGGAPCVKHTPYIRFNRHCLAGGQVLRMPSPQGGFLRVNPCVSIVQTLKGRIRTLAFHRQFNMSAPQTQAHVIWAHTLRSRRQWETCSYSLFSFLIFCSTLGTYEETVQNEIWGNAERWDSQCESSWFLRKSRGQVQIALLLTAQSGQSQNDVYVLMCTEAKGEHSAAQHIHRNMEHNTLNRGKLETVKQDMEGMSKYCGARC